MRHLNVLRALERRFHQKQMELVSTQLDLEATEFELKRERVLRQEAMAKLENAKRHLSAVGYLMKGVDILPVPPRTGTDRT